MKTILSLSVSALALVIFSGCGSEPKPEPIETQVAQNVTEFGCKQENVPAPKWTCIPVVENHYAGVGIYQKSKAGMSHMRRNAIAYGRADLAQQIEAQVKDKVELFTRTTGNGTDETVDHVTTSVTKQLANVNLKNAKAADTWNAPSGALYMLVTVPESNVNKVVKEAITTSFKSDNALWQQFQSEKAMEALDNEFPTN